MAVGRDVPQTWKKKQPFSNNNGPVHMPTFTSGLKVPLAQIYPYKENTKPKIGWLLYHEVLMLVWVDTGGQCGGLLRFSTVRALVTLLRLLSFQHLNGKSSPYFSPILPSLIDISIDRLSSSFFCQQFPYHQIKFSTKTKCCYVLTFSGGWSKRDCATNRGKQNEIKRGGGGKKKKEKKETQTKQKTKTKTAALR